MTHHLTNLPIDILFVIIGYLGQPGRDLFQCTLINRQFYQMVNPCLWRHINFHPHHHYQSFPPCLTLAHHSFLPLSLSLSSPPSSSCFFIRSLDLRRIHLTDEWLTAVLRHVPRLESLVLDNANRSFSNRDTRSTLNQLGERCPALQSLVIRQMPLSPALFHSLGQHCHQLHTFRVSMHDHTDRIPASVYAKFFTACPRIETLELDFDDCRFSSRRRCCHRWDAVNKFTHNLTMLPKLKRLMIGTSHRGMLHRAIQTSVGTATMTTPCWPHLTSLALQTHFSLLDHHVIALVRDCCAHGQLLYLQIWYAHLTNTALVALAKCQPHLQFLDLSDSRSRRDHHGDALFDAVGLGKLIGQCLQLNVIGLTRCLIKKGRLADDDTAYFPDWLDRETINKIRQRMTHSSSARVRGIKKLV